MHERIKAVRQALGLSQREFGRRLGTTRDVISNLEYGRTRPKEVFLRHLCAQYGVEERWLLRGEGPMFRRDAPDRQLEQALAIFRGLSPEGQECALAQLRALAALEKRRPDG